MPKCQQPVTLWLFLFLGMDIASMPNANGVRKGKGSTDSRSG